MGSSLDKERNEEGSPVAIKHGEETGWGHREPAARRLREAVSWKVKLKR